MPTIVKFECPAGIDVSVHRADALSLEADVAIMGRCREVRERLESLTGNSFEPYFTSELGGRQASILELEKGPWSRTVALDYRPRRASLERRDFEPDGWPYSPPHLDRLCADLNGLVHRAFRDFKPETLLFLPLSWRNPRVVSLAAVGVVWHYCWSIARQLREVEESPDHFVDTVMERLGDVLDLSAEDVRAQHEAMVARHAEQRRQSGYIRHFMFVDRDDPQPFVDALENRDGCLVQAHGIERDEWGACPFERVEEDL